MPFSEGCHEEDIPGYISWSTVAISSMLCIITVPGNLLTCIAIIKDPYKELRTPFNYFVINLVAADLIVGCVTEPAFIIYHAKEAVKGQKLQMLWIFHLTYFTSLTATSEPVSLDGGPLPNHNVTLSQKAQAEARISDLSCYLVHVAQRSIDLPSGRILRVLVRVR